MKLNKYCKQKEHAELHNEETEKMTEEEFLEKFEYKVIQPNINHIYYVPSQRIKPRFTFGDRARKTKHKCKKVQNRTLVSLMNIINFKSEQEDSRFSYF